MNLLRKILLVVILLGYNWSLYRLAQDSGEFKTSFCSTLLEDQEVTKELEYDIKWTACSMYAGSSDSVEYILLV